MTLESTKQELRESIIDSKDFLDQLLTREGFKKCLDNLVETQLYYSKPKAYYYTLCMAFLQILLKGIKPTPVLIEDWNFGENTLFLNVDQFNLLEDTFPLQSSVRYDDAYLLRKAKSMWNRDGVFGELLDKILEKAEIVRI